MNDVYQGYVAQSPDEQVQGENIDIYRLFCNQIGVLSHSYSCR